MSTSFSPTEERRTEKKRKGEEEKKRREKKRVRGVYNKRKCRVSICRFSVPQVLYQYLFTRQTYAGNLLCAPRSVEQAPLLWLCSVVWQQAMLFQRQSDQPIPCLSLQQQQLF